VERDLTKKESYFVFQSYWSEKPMAHIYGHSWPVRWGREGELRSVHVYSNCDRAELFLNHKSLGTLQRNSQDFPAAGLRWSVAFATGANRLRVVGTKGAVNVTDEIELAYSTEIWGEPAELRLLEKARRGGTATVEAKLYDAKGVLCLDSRNVVHFSLAGSGQLIDNLGTTRGSREIQLSNGRTEISASVKGRCVIGVASEGLSSAFLTLS
jgi:beta-galactosidase